jgi:hypothetical protein
MKRVATLIAATLVVLAFPIQSALAACHIAQFSPSEYDIKENAGKVTIGVQNPGPADGDRTVDWETVNGSAKAGSDFVAGSGTLSFSPSDTSKVIEVTIINNNKNESKETFTVRLKARPGSCISQDSIGPPATVTINDDDPKLVIPTPTPTVTKSVTPTPSPTRAASPSPTPTRTRVASPSPSLSPSPSPTLTPIAAPDEGPDGGLSGGALAGMVGGVVVLGGVAAFFVRRRFLT